MSDQPPVTEEQDERPTRLPVLLYRMLRQRLARGRATSRYWAPRIGDRVRLHGRGTWLVYGVSICRSTVTLGKPGVVALEHVAPATREDLAKFYDMDLDHKNRPIPRVGMAVPEFTNVTEDGEPEPEEAKLFLLRPASEPTAEESENGEPA